jgi:oxysterol-binding protein 1
VSYGRECEIKLIKFIFSRLEEQQRQRRRQKEAEAEEATSAGRPYPPYDAVWFKKEKEEGTDNVIHVYRGHYWESKKAGEWSRCPSIF